MAVSPKYFFYLILLAAIWGSSFAFIKVAADDFGAAPLMFLRVGISAIFLSVIFIWKGGLRRLGKQHIIPLTIAGVTGQTFPFFMYAYAELELSASLASILNATTPLWTAMIAWWMFKDRLNRVQMFGLFIGFLGVVYLMSKGDSASSESAAVTNAYILSVIAVLLATLSYGISGNYIKKTLNNVKSLDMAAGSTIGATVVALPFVLFTWPDTPIATDAWWAVIALGVLCSGVAFLIFFELIVNVGPTSAVSVTYLVPIFGVVWGILLLNESLTLTMVVSMVVILLGVMLSTKLLEPWFKKIR